MAYGGSDVPATDFAITTVNVPDRLDLRDMDDRMLENDARQRAFDPTAIRAWLPRIILFAVLAILVLFVLQTFSIWKAALSADSLSSRLTATLGVPVQIDSAQFSLTPSPRLVLTKVTINKDAVLSQIAISLTSRHVAQAFQGNGLNWGEATVSPSSISLAQGHDLMQLLPRLDGALPRGLTLIRFDHLQIADQPWLKGAWHVELERTANSGFTKAVARQSDGGGSIQIQLTPDTPEIVGFQLQAHHWTPPFGLKVPMETASAEGKASYANVDVAHYSLSGPFGEIHGALSGAVDGMWKINGDAQSDGVDIDALLRQLAPPRKTFEHGDADGVTLLQGMASFAGRIEGQGSSLGEAASASVFVAPVHVRSATLNGLNLGFIAMNPGANPEASGGSTRFASLDALLVASSFRTTIRDLHARAGALLALGEIDIMDNNDLSGVLHVDLGKTRVLAPIRLHVRGSLSDPKFGR